MKKRNLIPYQSDTGTEWFRIVLESMRYAVFVAFCLLSVRMVFVTLTHESLLVSMVIGAAGVVIALFTLWRTDWAIYAFIVLLPVVSGFQVIGFLNGLPLLSVGFAVMFLNWFCKRIIWDKKGIVSKTITGNLLDILAAIVLLSLIMQLVPYPVDYIYYRFWSWPFVGQYQQLYGMDGSYILLQGFFFYRLVELECRGRNIMKWVTPVFYVQAALIVCFSLVQWMFGIPGMHWGKYGITSPFNDIHSYGSYVVILFFLFLTLAVAKGGEGRWGNVIFAGILFVLLIWSGGNGTFLAMLGIGMVFLATTIKRVYFYFIALLLAILAVFIIISPKIITKSDYPVVRRYQKALDVKNIPKALHSRFLLWDRAAGIIKEFPLTGSGIGTFYRISPRYQNQGFNKWYEREDWRENAHNYYLQIGANLGIPALLIFLAIIFYTYMAGFTFVKKNTGKSKAIAKGLLFGLGAYLITMMTSHPLLLSNQQFLFWFVIAVINLLATDEIFSGN